jgi:tetratricopeptide (TPR) repeat protein
MLLAITLLAFWQARKRPWLIVGWLWFVGTLLPVIGFAQGGAQAWADRFTYWPHIGLLVAIIWGLGEAVDRFRIPSWLPGTVLGGALACLGVLTWIQVGYWRDTPTLWGHALAVTEDNHRAHLNLGKYHLDQGEFDQAEKHFAEAVRLSPKTSEYQYSLGVALLSLGRVKKAAEHFREALALAPDHSDSWHNLGVAQLRQGKPREAIYCFRKVLRLQPGSGDAMAALGLALWRAGRRHEAIQTYQTALKINPNEADAWSGLGSAHLVQGQPEKATEELTRALGFKPHVKTFSALGLALCRQGRWSDALPYLGTAVRSQDEAEEALLEMNGQMPTEDSIPPGVIYRCRLAMALHHLGNARASTEVYLAALKQDPHWPEKFTAQAWKLATAPDVNFRDPRLAYELASQAIQAVSDPTAAMLDALAAAHAALGQFKKAALVAQQALKKAVASAEESLARSIRKHLQLYEKGEAISVCNR